jgi:hypothetical protein
MDEILSRQLIHNTLEFLRPDSVYQMGDGYGDLIWISTDQTKPTESEYNTALASVKAEWTAQEYARNRASAYDSVGDQLDMIYKDMKDGTTTHQTACEAVKAKYPKPS